MPAKPVRLSNGRFWPTKGEAETHFKRMLGRYSVGQRVMDPIDHSDLAALIEIYDSVVLVGAPTKSGVGIDHFSKQTNRGERWSTAGFQVHRTDGTAIDFSYGEALTVACNKA